MVRSDDRVTPNPTPLSGFLPPARGQRIETPWSGRLAQGLLRLGPMRTLVVLAVLAGSTAAAVAGPIRVWESQDDASITEGETTLETDPDTAYASAIDYARWPSMFPDIVRANITKQQGDDARVTLVHRDGNKDNVHFHNTPQARMLWFEDTGGRAEVWAEIIFVPGDRPGTTRVHSRLFADVHGIASVVVSGTKVRMMRQQRVASDLSNLRAYFSTHAVTQR